jgi:ABC-type nitrate/sulfonate/bicarbonate transport system ATPase subunit
MRLGRRRCRSPTTAPICGCAASANRSARGQCCAASTSTFSTLLRLLSGLDRPDAGEIAIDGVADPKRGVVRIMFQDPRLLPWNTVARNVAVGRTDRVAPRERPGVVRQGLAAVGLGDRAAEWPSVLSGGQKQRRWRARWSAAPGCWPSMSRWARSTR